MTSPSESQIEQLASAFENWRELDSFSTEPLQALLDATDSRAVGLWKVDAEGMTLLAFAAKADMPAEVRDGFQHATQHVSLEHASLGIVKAVLNRGPAVASVQVGNTGLADSATWLAKFEAVQSLAVPLFAGENVVGVLAMSTAHAFEEHDPTWQLLTGIAERLRRD